MNIYYVYAYLRNKDSLTAKAGTPYYIGKGKDERAYVQHRGKAGGVYTPADRSKIVILESHLTNLGACAIERRLIRWYGRKDLKTGILHNRTAGGEGGDQVSQETIEKRRAKTVGQKRSLEARQRMSEAQKGHTVTDEARAKMSAAIRPPITEKTRQKLREAQQNMNFENLSKRIEALRKIDHKNVSSETREKLRQSQLGERNSMYGRISPFRGKKHSEEAKQKFQESIRRNREQRLNKLKSA